MARDYLAEFPGQVASNPTEYPQGEAKDVTVDGDGTGTPWNELILNDLWGFVQSLLSKALLTADGNTDKVGASQYFQALQRAAGLASVHDWHLQVPNGGYTSEFRGVARARFSDTLGNDEGWVIAGLAAEVQRSVDGVVWDNVPVAGGFGGAFTGIAAHSVGVASGGVAVVGDSGEIQRMQSLSGTLAQETAGAAFAGTFRGVRHLGAAPGGPVGDFFAVGDGGEIQQRQISTTWTRRFNDGGDNLNDITYDGTLTPIGPVYNGTQFVAVGNAGRILTASDPAGPWTARTPGGGFSDALLGVHHDGTNYIAVGEGFEIQTSPDGITWTHRYGNDNGSWVEQLRRVMSFRGLVLAYGEPRGAAGTDGSGPEMLVSRDNGLTWTRTLTGVLNANGSNPAIHDVAVDTDETTGLSSRLLGVGTGGHIIQTPHRGFFL